MKLSIAIAAILAANMAAADTTVCKMPKPAQPAHSVVFKPKHFSVDILSMPGTDTNFCICPPAPEPDIEPLVVPVVRYYVVVGNEAPTPEYQITTVPEDNWWPPTRWFIFTGTPHSPDNGGHHGHVSAPEIDPASGATALTLLAGLLIVVTHRR